MSVVDFVFVVAFVTAVVVVVVVLVAAVALMLHCIVLYCTVYYTVWCNIVVEVITDCKCVGLCGVLAKSLFTIALALLHIGWNKSTIA